MPTTKSIFDWNFRLAVVFAVAHLCLFPRAYCELRALPVIGKPALLSTAHSEYPAWQAVDGNLGTIAHNARNDPHPMLRVDLENEHCIGRITVTLRDSGCGNGFYKEQNTDPYTRKEACFTGTVVRAGLSENFAENQPCGLPATPDQSGKGAVNPFLCETPRMARYVSLDIDRSRPDVTDPTLKIAEVEVEEYTAGECDTMCELRPRMMPGPDFKRLYKGSRIANPDPLATEVAKYLTSCASHCLIRAKCFSFDFAPTSSQCHLHSLNSTDIMIAENGDFSIYELLWE